jgi:hypothetical protein
VFHGNVLDPDAQAAKAFLSEVEKYLIWLFPDDIISKLLVQSYV